MLINFLLFQIGWFAAVLSAAELVPWLGVAVILVVVGLHLRWSQAPGRELALVMICAGLGAAFDSLLVAAGWVSYPSGQILPGVAPYWIVAMWMSFATTLNVSLRWLRHRPLLAAAFGAGGGPLAYYTGEKLGGIVLTDFTAAMLMLGLGWGLMMPALCALSRRFDGRQPQAVGQPLILE